MNHAARSIMLFFSSYGFSIILVNTMAAMASPRRMSTVAACVNEGGEQAAPVLVLHENLDYDDSVAALLTDVRYVSSAPP